MVLKRIRVTKNGKLMRKRGATNHFNARRSRSNMQRKRHAFALNDVNSRTIVQFLPYTASKNS